MPKQYKRWQDTLQLLNGGVGEHGRFFDNCDTLCVDLLRHYRDGELCQRFEECTDPSNKTNILRYYWVWRVGGWWVDTDVQPIASFDRFADEDFVIGKEGVGTVCPAVFGAMPGHPLLRYLLDAIIDDGPDPDGRYGTMFISKYLDPILNPFRVSIQPAHVFSPVGFDHRDNEFMQIHRDTVTIHHMQGSWHE